MRSRCPPRQNGRDHRSGHHRTARERAFRKRCIAERHFDFVERHAGFFGGELREDRVGAGADVLRAAGDAGGAIVAKLDVGLRREIAPRSTRTRPFPNRASTRRASSSRLRELRFDQPNFFRAKLEALEIMPRRKRNA